MNTTIPQRTINAKAENYFNAIYLFAGMVVHYNITVKGKVQGVSFRASAIDMAIRLGVKGFVKNTPEGHVNCEVEGEEEMLHRFIQWCHHGPPNAQVEHVSITGGNVKGFASFEMRM